MTLADQHVPVAAWKEPEGLIPRGTVVVIPGRAPATVVLFLERIWQDAGPHPIAVWEQLGR